MENLKSDTRGQTAVLYIFVGGIMFFGGMYILLGFLMGNLVTLNNLLISNHAIPYSQDHKSAMDNMFRLWWIVPVIFLLMYAYYMVKKALERKPEDFYV